MATEYLPQEIAYFRIIVRNSILYARRLLTDEIES